MSAPTREFIETLQSLKPGDLGLLRKHAGLPLDESLQGFDLFTGLWWPLRQKNQSAPRREIAWLIAKVYAFCPLPQSDDDTLARLLHALRPAEKETGTARQKSFDELLSLPILRRPSQSGRFQRRFDELLSLPISQIESALQWAVGWVADHDRAPRLDWVRLTDELSIWQREETRLEWAAQFL